MPRSASERLTHSEWQAMAADQDGRCPDPCGAIVARYNGRKWVKVGHPEADHTIPNALRSGKPDVILCATCHAIKTKRDVKRIAKARRQARETGQQARRAAGKTKPIPSRGFSKTLRRRMDGTVKRV